MHIHTLFLSLSTTLYPHIHITHTHTHSSLLDWCACTDSQDKQDMYTYIRELFSRVRVHEILSVLKAFWCYMRLFEWLQVSATGH